MGEHTPDPPPPTSSSRPPRPDTSTPPTQGVNCYIVCMLIALWTGRKPTLRTVEMIRFYFIGWADEEELMTHIAKLQAAKE